MVLINGLAQNRLAFSHLLPKLTNNFRVLIFDNRAAGQSTTASPFTIQDMATDTIALLDHVNIKEAYILGYSMGGMILEDILVSHPHRVKKAIICSSAAKLPIKTKLCLWSQARLVMGNVAAELIINTILPWLYSNHYLSDKNLIKKAINTILTDPYPQSAEAFVAQVNAIIDFDIVSQLTRIKTPTLVITGEEDLLIPSACSLFLQEQLGNATIEIIKNASHMIPVEYPDMLTNLILSFFADGIFQSHDDGN